MNCTLELLKENSQEKLEFLNTVGIAGAIFTSQQGGNNS